MAFRRIFNLIIKFVWFSRQTSNVVSHFLNSNIKIKTKARLGALHLAHGDVPTILCPSARKPRSKLWYRISCCGAPIILANAYHLHLRRAKILWPNSAVCISLELAASDFNGQRRVSGFSLGKLTKKCHPRESGDPECHTAGFPFSRNDNQQQKISPIDDNGVSFRSHLDGSMHRFPRAPLNCHKLGADIMAFDHALLILLQEDTRAAMERTHEWAIRCLDFHLNTKARERLNTGKTLNTEH